MMTASLSATGFVLSRNLTAGGYERLGLLSAQNGFLRPLRRLSSKTENRPCPDLFDLCSVALESGRGGAWFLREYEVLRRFSGIGARYEALEAASDWARLAGANAPELESCAKVSELTFRFFDALDKGFPVQAVLLKTYYLFAGSEGLPVREEWLAGLSSVQRKTADTALRTPLGEVSESAVSFAGLASLNGDVVSWMCRNHHIVPALRRES